MADLKTVGPDAVLHGGDLVGSGARPAEVIDVVRDLGWPGVLGNTDEMLWASGKVSAFFAPPALQPWRDIVSRNIAATVDAIGDEQLGWLRELPDRLVTGDIAIVHARPDDLWRSPHANATDDELADVYGALGASRVIYGHIHCPFVRRLPAFTVANSGSVGLPYDGDPRAAYLIVDDDRIELRRVEYDIDREVDTLFEAGWPDAAWLAETLRQGRPVPPPA